MTVQASCREVRRLQQQDVSHNQLLAAAEELFGRGLEVRPAEVEEVLRLSPSVADAAVVGVPDDRLGEVPVALVVGATDARCRTHLAPYEVPLRFEPVDARPRNEAGKVVTRELLRS